MWLKTFCLIFLFSSATKVIQIHSLENGICKKRVETYFSKSFETQRSGQVKCWGRAVPYFYTDRTCQLGTTSLEIYECCNGYYNNTLGECLPICTKPCENGYCSSPNTCTCNGGFSKTSGVCRPTCRHCTNGICVAPNQCICMKGFERNNAGLCVPKCNGICLNGVCDNNGDCICQEGYFRSNLLANFDGLANATLCTPNCDKPCLNGQCIGRNLCQCFEGFRSSSSSAFECEPICLVDCINGKCILPNYCQCDKGYQFVDDHCSPICDPPCENGVCVEPSKCVCQEGYSSENIKMHNCLPVCHNPCKNGTCVAPNQCACNNGYVSSFNASGFDQCVPFCDSQFIEMHNGQCIAPNVIQCDDNYTLTSDRASKKLSCQKECYPSCVNGRCNEDDQCECLSGFVQAIINSPHICTPICDPPCENGHCVAPNVCKCHEGHETHLENSNVCLPTCDPQVVDCTNGVCASINTCECNEGYNLVKDESMVLSWNESSQLRCLPICNYLPVYSECVAPGMYHCLEGYAKKIDDDLDYCIPVCEKRCHNGSCTAPNVCTCSEGFRKNDYDDCQSICESDCEGLSGTCVENKCQCFEGYNNLINNYQCSPTCDRCENGDCIALNVCNCFDGYSSNKTGVCEPICNNCSDTAICQEPNKCSCYEGWEPSLDEENKLICIEKFRSTRQTHLEEPYIVLIAISSLAGIIILLTTTYLRCRKFPENNFGTVKMSEIKVIE
ncbi:von Willebrand factor D and EGF domain-containing protein-like [Anopheles darlingi]|uniref:von Willebrand factor D and EGF domain-containing protein-like n=1 Tax=Anopheles darlingi TaxID=43151 RepID=UPI0020FFFEBA|nr:von Willebrand factor D and EGF domain-containing protein-like [Anopheles darlingi]